MKVGLIATDSWQNKNKIQDVIQKLKSKFGDSVIIGGAGGNDFGNMMIRKYSIEFGLQYKEFNPSFTGFNLYSALPEDYYGRKYHFSQLIHRMKLLALDCDYLIVFSNVYKMHPSIETAVKTAKKQEKNVVIIE
jgi:hypothetical protein